MSQLTRPGPAASGSLRARSVAPPATRPGPRRRRRGRCHDNVAAPQRASGALKQKLVPPLKETQVKGRACDQDVTEPQGHVTVNNQSEFRPTGGELVTLASNISNAANREPAPDTMCSGSVRWLKVLMMRSHVIVKCSTGNKRE